MKIGILGGSFNPPHKMHLKIALDLINKQYVDKIIYVPTGSRYKYKSNLVGDRDRYEMVRLLTKDYDNLSVSDYELKEEVVYTCETLEYFKNEYTNDEIYFICGTDNLTYMDTWKNGKDILSNYKILVIKRLSDDINEMLVRFNEYKDNIIVTDIEQSTVSSTIIRDGIKNDKDINELITDEVLEYIKKNKLYEKEVIENEKNNK